MFVVALSNLSVVFLRLLRFCVELSSGADSSDWEKEFDLDMTEDEINEVLLDGVDEVR